MLEKIERLVEKIGAVPGLDGLAGARVLKEDREEPVLQEPEVAGHDRDMRAGAPDGDRVLVPPAQAQDPGDGPARVDLPSPLRRAHRRLRHVDPVGHRHGAGITLPEDERVPADEHLRREHGGPPDGGDAEELRAWR